MHSASDSQPQPTASPQGLRVLVVDDIQASREALAEQVQALGHACITCESGEQALTLIPEVAPDLLLLDLWMPGLFGFEVVRRLRDQVNDRWLPVIVTSALQGEAHFIDALSRGADDYLARPVNADLLRVKLMHYARVLGLQSGLARLARREQLVHEHIPDAVLTLDGQGRLCEANRAGRDLLARRGVGEPMGRVLIDLLGPQVAQWLLDSGGMNAGTEAADLPVGAHDLTLVLGHDETLPVAVSASRWQSGNANYCTLVLRDQTERRRVDRMKEEFLATVSHELRTPLTSIVGALGLLSAGVAGALSPGAQELLSVASRNGQRLSRLIDDVLDLTKLEGDGLQFNLQPCALAPVLIEAIKGHTALARRRGITLNFHDDSAQASIQADPHRLLQVMGNLLTNALRHTPEGSTVEVRLFGCADGWCVEVEDQGPGISPEFRRRLFEKFAQEDSSDRRTQGGTGLGLHIARQLTERMGGRIGERNLQASLAQNAGVRGACFYLLFPALRPDQHRPRLLGVARDTLQLAQWREWLAPWADLDSAATPEQAQVRLAQGGPVQLILADPTSQGSADAFCAALQRLVKPHGLLLVSDAVDAAFAARHGLVWVGRHAQARLQLQQAVRRALSQHATAATSFTAATANGHPP